MVTNLFEQPFGNLGKQNIVELWLLTLFLRGDVLGVQHSGGTKMHQETH